MRRCIDTLVALVLLVLLSPVLAAGAVVIKVTSRGPLIYRQTRLGQHGTPFTMLKLRTMVVGGDADGRLTVGDDPRITRVGRFLRRHRLDELPQLVNVLRGDMALVGSRPEVPEYLRAPSADQRELLSQRPGLTDPASLAFRGEAALLAAQADPEAYYRDVVMPAKARCSVEYARHRTLLTDLRVLLLTAACLVRTDDQAPDGEAAVCAQTASPPTQAERRSRLSPDTRSG